MIESQTLRLLTTVETHEHDPDLVVEHGHAAAEAVETVKSVVQDDVEEGAVHMEATVVIQKAKFAELIHEETDAGACGPDHLGERFLTDLRNDRLRLAFFPEVRQQQEDPRQPLLGRIKELIHQILLDANRVRQQIGT